MVLAVFLVWGPSMFEMKYERHNTPDMVKSENSEVTVQASNKLYHMTFLFNTFIMMTLFNQVNCRRLGSKEFNIFERILSQKTFILILVIEVLLQLVIVECGQFFKPLAAIFTTTPLPIEMWVTSIVCGLLTWIVAVLVKCTPEEWLAKIHVPFREVDLYESSDLLSLVYLKACYDLKRTETESLYEKLID